jgi:hypothetical protein
MATASRSPASLLINIQHNLAVRDGLAEVRALQILDGHVKRALFGYLIALTRPVSLQHISIAKG